MPTIAGPGQVEARSQDGFLLSSGGRDSSA